MNSTRHHQPYSDSKKYKIRTTVKSVIAAAAGLLFIAVFHIALRSLESDQGADSSPPAESVSRNSTLSPFSVATETEHGQIINVLREPLPADIYSLVKSGKYNQAKNSLLQQASLAVERDDHQQLAEILSYLGEVALLQGNLDTAEAYLTEALDLFDQNYDEIATAGVYQQLGRLHLIARQRARLASAAYDTLLVARWKISQGQFSGAASELRRAAEDNLSLNRYGAAASVYETLYKGYQREGDTYQAQLAGVEAVKLHASSGRTFNAQAILESMRQSGLSETEFTRLTSEINVLNQDYERSVLALGAARDQALLYNQLQARGDVINAWRFRQQADASAAKASNRALYRRQPDVLIELYKSNFSMKNAQASLQRAQELYQRHGIDTQQLQELQAKIF